MKRSILAVPALTLLLAGCGEKAPSREKVQEAVKKIMPVNFEVLDVSKTPQVKSLYQVVIRVDRQPVVFYIDKDAKYAFSGSILDIESKKNLTAETQKRYQQR